MKVQYQFTHSTLPAVTLGLQMFFIVKTSSEILKLKKNKREKGGKGERNKLLKHELIPTVIRNGFKPEYVQ